MTDQDIYRLIHLPKTILSKTPFTGYREENGYKRCDLDLQAVDGSAMFRVFIRQNTNFIENFSIGLLYHTGDRMLRTIALVRYNGPHGETSRNPDGHFGNPHIHRITETEN